MNMVKATRRFEEWLRRRTAVVEPDLRTKHKHMAEAAFPFLRATFYRWMQVWPEVCSDLAKAPKVLAVGDLHIENFGTWRDAEGRLIWGVNDFDEAYPMAYSNDLVRLAASAHVAIAERHHWLRHAATSDLRDPVVFWKKMDTLPTWPGSIPKSAQTALRSMLPDPK